MTSRMTPRNARKTGEGSSGRQAATSDYPDLGYGSLSADEVQRATLVILARDTADVITTETFIDRTTAASGVEQLLVAKPTNGVTSSAHQAALVP